MADVAKSSPILRFDPALPKKDLEKIRDNVTAVILDGRHLGLGGDEGTSIHRMTRDASGGPVLRGWSVVIELRLSVDGIRPAGAGRAVDGSRRARVHLPMGEWPEPAG